MKSGAFAYVRPATLDEAIAALAHASGDAALMAGGQSLVAMMNLRVVSPDLVIDIGRLTELCRVSETRDAVTLGAGVTHAAIEDGVVPDPSRGLMPSVAANIAYRAVRTRGTIGGSLALSDPAADWPAVMAALGATIVLRGPGGAREVNAASFATGIYETAREPGEIVAAIVIPKLSETARWGFRKFCRKSGEFAHSIGVAVVDPTRHYARVVLGAAGGPPLVLAHASALLAAEPATDDAISAAITEDFTTHDVAFDDYQVALHTSMVMRAMRQALSPQAPMLPEPPR